jgi:hypothetical protein
LKISPSLQGTVYAGTYEGGVFKSTNAGASWTGTGRLTRVWEGQPFIPALAIDPTDPDTVYAGTFGAGIFKSSDGGRTWQPTGAN